MQYKAAATTYPSSALGPGQMFSQLGDLSLLKSPVLYRGHGAVGGWCGDLDVPSSVFTLAPVGEKGVVAEALILTTLAENVGMHLGSCLHHIISLPPNHQQQKAAPQQQQVDQKQEQDQGQEHQPSQQQQTGKQQLQQLLDVHRMHLHIWCDAVERLARACGKQVLVNISISIRSNSKAFGIATANFLLSSVGDLGPWRSGASFEGQELDKALGKLADVLYDEGKGLDKALGMLADALYLHEQLEGLGELDEELLLDAALAILEGKVSEEHQKYRDQLVQELDNQSGKAEGQQQLSLSCALWDLSSQDSQQQQDFTRGLYQQHQHGGSEQEDLQTHEQQEQVDPGAAASQQAAGKSSSWRRQVLLEALHGCLDGVFVSGDNGLSPYMRFVMGEGYGRALQRKGAGEWPNWVSDPAATARDIWCALHGSDLEQQQQAADASLVHFAALLLNDLLPPTAAIPWQVVLSYQRVLQLNGDDKMGVRTACSAEEKLAEQYRAADLLHFAAAARQQLSNRKGTFMEHVAGTTAAAAARSGEPPELITGLAPGAAAAGSQCGWYPGGHFLLVATPLSMDSQVQNQSGAALATAAVEEAGCIMEVEEDAVVNLQLRRSGSKHSLSEEEKEVGQACAKRSASGSLDDLAAAAALSAAAAWEG